MGEAVRRGPLHGAMDEPKTTRTVTVANSQGFHLRAATLFSVCARRFRSQIAITKGRQTVDGKSTPLHLVGLGAGPGDQVVLEASGPDAKDALDALVELFASHFETDESSGATDRCSPSENVTDDDAVAG